MRGCREKRSAGVLRCGATAVAVGNEASPEEEEPLGMRTVDLLRCLDSLYAELGVGRVESALRVVGAIEGLFSVFLERHLVVSTVGFLGGGEKENKRAPSSGSWVARGT